jgi:tRNA U34 5-methylaminomethyl-2-thiouridine-forming methyltransferase MnmC
MADLEIIVTGDGSHSLRHPDLNETYHSVHGAIRESMHVFVSNGLEFFEQRHHPEKIRILEIGFGTGLNALLTLRKARESKTRIQYTAIEAYPLTTEIVSQLNYPSMIDPASSAEQFDKLHSVRWDTPEAVSGIFILEKKKVTLQEADLGLGQFDLIYFDAFAPGKQPEMWELPILNKVERCMRRDAVFVTYCAKGQLKRDLKSLGLVVGTLAGPPGKKEMIRAVKS